MQLVQVVAWLLPNIKLREDIHEMNMMPSEEGETSHMGKRHGLGWKGMDYMFDADHFKKSLKISCPKLNIIDHMEQTVNERRRGLSPESLFLNRPISGLEHLEEWQEKLTSWIEKWMSPTPNSIQLSCTSNNRIFNTRHMPMVMFSLSYCSSIYAL